MPIDVVVVSVGLLLYGVALPLLLYPKGCGYKKDNRVGDNMISIKTLSLLDYYIYFSIDIIIYVLSSSHIFLKSSEW
jgi:hypothetical protein